MKFSSDVLCPGSNPIFQAAVRPNCFVVARQVAATIMRADKHPR